MAMDSDTPFTARGLLMLSLRPRLILTTMVLDTDLDTLDTLDTPDTSDTMADSDTTVRGLLMLSLKPRPILTTLDTDLDTEDTLDTPDTLDTDTAESTTANRFHQDLSVNHRLDLRQKWIVIILKFPSTVLQFQCCHTKSLVMVSRKQENQSGKIPTNIEITKINFVLFLIDILRLT